MKRTLKFLGLVLMLLVLFPVNVFAYYTEEEANELLDKVSSEYDQELYESSGEKFYILNLPSVNPVMLTGDENTCKKTKEDLLATCGEGGSGCYYESFTDEEWADVLLEVENSCMYELTEVVLKAYFKSLGITNYFDLLVEIAGNTLVVGVPTGYNEDDGNVYVSRVFDIKFVSDYDKKTHKDAVNILDTFDDQYNIYGLRVLNAIYHYGGIDEAVYNNDLVLYRFPEVKEIMEQYKEYDFSITLGGAGGTSFMSGNNGYIVVYKDGVMLAAKNVNFDMYHTVLVDKNEKGTIFEKAEKRISNYFGNKSKISIKTENIYTFEDEWLDDIIGGLIGKKDKTFSYTSTTVTIDGKTQDVVLLEVDKADLDKVDIKATDYDTDISINTDSYEVPIDVTIKSEDVKDKDYVKEASKDKKIEFKHVYDINLIGKGNGKHIKTIDAGVEVCIPIDGYKEGDKVTVYYISENGKAEEKYDAEVITIDGKMYAKFITKHFSTYGVATLDKEEVVPDTGDLITRYFVILSISAIGIIITKKYLIN